MSMAFTNTRENGFEALIVNWLVEHNGYEEGSKNRPNWPKEGLLMSSVTASRSILLTLLCSI